MINFNEYLDQIFSEFIKPEYNVLMTKAKDQFVDFAGSFDEDNLDIEMKWSQFRDWFLFSYLDRLNYVNGVMPNVAVNPLKNEVSSSDTLRNDGFKDLSPFQILFSEQFQAQLNIPKDIMDAILGSHTSVFQHLKSYKDQIKVRDLITRIKHYVFDEDVQLILERKDYIQTRIFKFENKYYFGGSFVLHPPMARKFIDSKIKLLKKEKDKAKKAEFQSKFLESVFKMYYRALRFRQVEIQKIYSDQPLFERKTQVSL